MFTNWKARCSSFASAIFRKNIQCSPSSIRQPNFFLDRLLFYVLNYCFLSSGYMWFSFYLIVPPAKWKRRDEPTSTEIVVCRCIPNFEIFPISSLYIREYIRSFGRHSINTRRYFRWVSYDRFITWKDERLSTARGYMSLPNLRQGSKWGPAQPQVVSTRIITS